MWLLNVSTFGILWSFCLCVWRACLNLLTVNIKCVIILNIFITAIVCTMQNPDIMGRPRIKRWSSLIFECYEVLRNKFFCNNQDLFVYCQYTKTDMLCIKDFSFKLVKKDPFRLAIKITLIYNTVFWTMFLKPDNVGIIPWGGIEWETARLLKLYNGRSKLVKRWTMLLMPEMEWRYFSVLVNVIEYLGCFGMSVDICIMNISPSATLEKFLGAGMRRLNRGSRKCQTLATNLFRSGGASLKYYCVTIRTSEMKFFHTTNERIFQKYWSCLLRR